MPQTIQITRRFATSPTYPEPLEVEVATEAELLEFANKVRAAGAADALDALLPSSTGSPTSCLIANALNFQCRVDSVEKGEAESYWLKPNQEFDWYMYLGGRRELAQNIADSTGSTFVDFGNNSFAVILPQHIGNAAHAFDSGDAFESYAVKEI